MRAFPDITVVIPIHDGASVICQTLLSVFEAGTFAAIHVLDSGSRDGGPEMVRREFPQVEVTLNSENVGPCITRNQGLREARTPYVLWLDDDTTVSPELVAGLKDALESDPQVAMAGPRVCFDDTPGVIQYEGGDWHYVGLPHFPGHGESPAPGPTRYVDVLTSTCLLVRREPVLAAGGFNERYFYLVEDVELSGRLRLLGHRLLVVPGVLAVNSCGSEGLSLKDGAYPEGRMFFQVRNRCLMILGLYHPLTLLMLWPAFVLFDLAWFAFAILAGNPGVFLRARVDVLRNLSAIRQSRSALRGRRRLRDRELLGAPSLTFTREAMAQPLARRLAGILDGVMRVYWVVVRGALP